MEIYQTEEQQVEAIKGYWEKNGTTIIAGIVLGFAGFIGFTKFQENKLETELAISDAYQALIDESNINAEEFTANAEKFINENANTSYGALTALGLAKKAASHKDWAEVQKQLTMAISSAPTKEIKAIASLRLARVQVQLEQYTEALATLDSQLPIAFTAAIEEIKGDIYLQQGKKDLARSAYQAAIAADGISTSPILQVKLDDLAEVTTLPMSEATLTETAETAETAETEELATEVVEPTAK